MATQGRLVIESMEAAGAIVKYTFVTVTGEYLVDTAGVADAPIGVAQNGVDAAGKTVAVAVDGRPKVIASAAIAAGAEVGVAANGEARTAVSGDTVVGTAVSVADAAGELVTIEMGRGYVKA